MSPQTTRPEYPAAPRSDVVDDYHGTAVADPYRWLEDREDPRTQEWLDAQHALMATERTAWTHQDDFIERISALLGAGTVSPPYYRGERHFLTRREPGQQFSILYIVDADGSERALIDPMTIDPTGLTTLDTWQPSKEGDRLAYQLSVGGNEESLLYVMDVATGDTIEGPIDRCRYSPVAWVPGGEQYYYVRRLAPNLLPEAERNFHRRVYLHTVGASPDDDVEVFGEGMTMTNYYGVEVSLDGHWLQVSASEGTEPRNDLWVADLTSSPLTAPAFEVVQEDVDAQTSLSFARDGRVFVSTDLDAPRARLAVTTPGQWTSVHWVDLVPEDPEAVLESVTVLDGPELGEDLILVVRTSHGVAHMTLHRSADGALIKEIELPGAGTIGGPVEHIEGGPLTWFVFTDHTTVPTIYQYDARTDEVTLYAKPPGSVEVPAVHSIRLVLLGGT